jgi:hypothetical protein
MPRNWMHRRRRQWMELYQALYKLTLSEEEARSKLWMRGRNFSR